MQRYDLKLRKKNNKINLDKAKKQSFMFGDANSTLQPKNFA